MTTATRTRKPARRASFEPFADGVTFIGMAVTTPHKTMADKVAHFGYFLNRIEAAFGLSFRLKKAGQVQDGEGIEYDVNIDLQYGRHSCECKGHLRHGHCKHVESILALIKAGKIEVPAPKQQPSPEPIEFDDP